MLQKWQRQPARVGMVAGFVVVPLLWWLQDKLLFFAIGFHSLPQMDFFSYFAFGAGQGTVLGGGISQILLAAHAQNWRAVKRYLLFYGAGVSAFFFIGVATTLLLYWEHRDSQPVVSKFLLTSLRGVWGMNEFPLQVALLMLFLGALMRSRR